MFSTLPDFETEAYKNLTLCDEWIETQGLTQKVVADHLGYRCSSVQEFESIRRLFEENSVYVYQSIISRRRICIIKLKNPLQTQSGVISFLELSDQKPDGSQHSGFDHVEFFPVATIAIPHIVEQLTAQGVVVVKNERPHHTTYDVSLHDSFKIKFEPESLIAKIIREEIRQD